jgi:hypothetical protein
MDTRITHSFKNTIALPNLGEIPKKIGEVSIDIFLKDGALKELPRIGSLIDSFKTIQNFM